MHMFAVHTQKKSSENWYNQQLWEPFIHWLWLIIVFVCAFLENDGSVDVVLPGDVEPDSKNSPRFVESEEPKRQFKTAEIADAVMGTEASLSPSDIESFIPKNMKDSQSGFSPPCEESRDRCAEPAVAADEEPPEETSSEPSQQVTAQELYYLITGIHKYI